MRPQLQGIAPAKLNLALHVTGRREDGYHLLDSLVAFAEIGDELSVRASATLTMSVEGPFAEGVPTDEDNLVLRAARALAEARGVSVGAHIKLMKRLPHAAGIGGASSDAAVALGLLATFWSVAPLPADHPSVRALGADVPVCLAAPQPYRMSGIGEALARVPPLPQVGVVLVNPGVQLPTAKVFAALQKRSNPPLEEIPESWGTADRFCEWLARQRNDLVPAARSLSPEVDAVFVAMAKHKGILTSTMSGSGPTCIGLTRSVGEARSVARGLQLAHQGWWVAPARLLS